MSEFIRGNDRIEEMLQRQGVPEAVSELDERAYTKGTHLAQQDVPDVVTEKPYTPTTEEVEFSYANNRFLAEHGQAEAQRMFAEEFGKVLDFRNEYVAEFDRWLAEVKAQEDKAERERAMSIIMTNIGQIVWQARHNPEGQAIDMSKMYEAIMGIDDE